MSLCECDDPEIDPDSEYGDTCAKCSNTIGYPIIDGEVHAGYTNLGNGEAFFEAKERELQGDPQSGTICDDYYRDFMSMKVVVPHHTEDATLLGTDWVSFDHVVEPDGSVDLVVYNRRLENLPGGSKFPVEDGTRETTITDGGSGVSA